jgi:dTDP-4-amino-4,6-dideoxygalactose transaminase
MGNLAITGGQPSRKNRFEPWPYYTDAEREALDDVLTNRNWGGQPFPGKHGDAFGKKFAAFHTASYGQAVNTGTVAIQAALKAIDECGACLRRCRSPYILP